MYDAEGRLVDAEGRPVVFEKARWPFCVNDRVKRYTMLLDTHVEGRNGPDGPGLELSHFHPGWVCIQCHRLVNHDGEFKSLDQKLHLEADTLPYVIEYLKGVYELEKDIRVPEGAEVRDPEPCIEANIGRKVPLRVGDDNGAA